MWGTFLNKAPDPLFDPVEVPENDGDVNKEECKARHQQSKVWVNLISQDQIHLTNNGKHSNYVNYWWNIKVKEGSNSLGNLDVSPQNQSRHHSFVPPVRKSQFLQASHQVAGKDIMVRIWINDWTVEGSHFQWHIRWIPFPTQQHQDHQREGPTSCLWG